jgi:hypothetical protein
MEGFASADIVTLVVLTVILLAGLFLLRLMFKLTASLFRLGCFVVLLIVAGAAVFMFLN